MIAKIIYNTTLTGLLLMAAWSSNASRCDFNLLPSEQLVIKGNAHQSVIFNCQVNARHEENNPSLSFIADSNTSVVNQLSLPEGTLMPLALSSLKDGNLTFKLNPNARLGVTNHTNECIKLDCKAL